MDEELQQGKSTSNERKFDVIIGHIEDIVVDMEFQEMQLNFMDKYYHEFDDSEENKLSYTPIFHAYVNMLEKYIEKELCQRIKHFNMAAFMKELDKQRDNVTEELLEMLLSFTDFLTFKQIMLDHKNFRDGKVVDLTFGLTVTPIFVDEELPAN